MGCRRGRRCTSAATWTSGGGSTSSVRAHALRRPFPNWALLAPHFGSLALAHGPAPTAALVVVSAPSVRSCCYEATLACACACAAPRNAAHPARCLLPLGRPLRHTCAAQAAAAAHAIPTLKPGSATSAPGLRAASGICPFPACHPGASGPHGAHGLRAGGGAGILFSNGLMQILKTVLVRLRRCIALPSAFSRRRAPVGVLRLGRCLSSSAGS